MRLSGSLPILAINLDKDTERWAAIAAGFGALSRFDLRRCPGVNALHLPDVAARALTNRAKPGKGTLGCFLAHVGAWERVAAASDAWALIIEDDAVPKSLERLFDVRLPDDAGIIWLNERMNPDPDRDPSALPQVEPTFRALRRKAHLDAAGAAPGADGYLLSPRGARELLTAVARDGFGGHVDWRMLRYTLDPAHMDTFQEAEWAKYPRPLDRSTLSLSWNVTTGYCLTPALISTRRSFSSSRAEIDRVQV